MKIGLPLMKNVLTPLAISILVILGITAAPSATDAALIKKPFSSRLPSDLAKQQY